jgi:hypothetical protein
MAHQGFDFRDEDLVPVRRPATEDDMLGRIGRGEASPGDISDQALERILGLPPVERQEASPEQFQVGGLGRFAEALGQTFQEPEIQQTNPFAALLMGAAGGLAGRGKRISAERAKFEEGAAKRQVERDAANLAASRERRKTLETFRGQQVGEQIKATREAERKRLEKEEEQFVLTGEQAALIGAPRLAGQKIDRKFYLQRLAEPTLAEIKAQEKAKAEGRAEGEPDEGFNITPAGLDVVATTFAKTGQMPTMGRGAQGQKAREAVINRAAELFGPELDIAGNKASFESNKAALTNLRKIHTAATAFSNTVDKNAHVLRESLKGLIDSGSPLINRPIRQLQTAVGDPNLRSFRTALATVQPEFARLLNSPSATGVVTVDAQQHMREILDENATPRELLAALSILERDGRNRLESYDAQIKEIEKEIRKGPGASKDEEPVIPEAVRGPDGKLVRKR